MNSFTYSSTDTINNISASVKRYNFTSVVSKATCHANPGAEEKRSSSSSYILRHVVRKISNTSTNNNLPL